MNYYKRYPGDYARDTGSLSLAEHGAYTVLLDHYYSTGSIPVREDDLFRLCRAMNKAEQVAVMRIANQFFPIVAGRRINNRADEEISKWESKADTNRSNGARGGRPQKEPTENPDGFEVGLIRVNGHEPKNNLLQNPYPEEEPPNPQRGDVDMVFEHWKAVHGHPKAKLDEKRRKSIRNALKIFTAEDLCKAIGGYKKSRFHMGENDQRKVYDDIETLLRSAKQIETGLQLAEQPSDPLSGVQWQ